MKWLSIVVAAAWLPNPAAAADPAARGYVDQKLCASCHPGIYASYIRAGMSRSLAPPPAESAPPFYHAASETWFEIVRRDGGSYLRRWQIGYGGRETNIDETRIDYVMGSGDHARAYLHREANGKLMELPVAWYSENGGFFGMAPGYDARDHQYGRRAITYDCFFCHDAYTAIPPGNERLRDEPVFPDDIPAGIDCQRCHGPGARHIDAARDPRAQSADVRQAIVNPARLDAGRRMEVCMQCHLQTTSLPLPDSIQRYGRDPFSFVPGQALGDFRVFFTRPPGSRFDGDFEIDHSAFRLRQSQCFLRSAGALTCTTCHNPHETPPRGAEALAHYDGVCRQCHAASLAKLAAAGKHPATTDCAGCHMPKRRTADVVHAVVTDHLIQRDKPQGNLLAPLAERDETSPYRGEVIPYSPAPDELYAAIAQVRDRSNVAAGIPRLTRALERTRPASPEPWFELAEALRRNRQLDKAIAMYGESLRRDAQYLAALMGLGSAHQEAGRRTQAAEAFRQATRAAPNDARTWNALGTVELESGRLAPARAAFEKAIAAEAEMPEPHDGLGIVATREGDLQGAEAQFREAIRLLPNYARAHGNLGQLLATTKDFPQAAWEFAAEVKLLPNDAAARFNHAVALSEIGRLTESQAEMEASIRLNPNVAEAHDLLGHILERNRKTDEAQSEYETALRIRPDLSRAQLDLGAILARKGDRERAAQYFKKAAQSSDPEIRALALRMMQDVSR